jgi:hypothetical protein
MVEILPIEKKQELTALSLSSIAALSASISVSYSATLELLQLLSQPRFLKSS